MKKTILAVMILSALAFTAAAADKKEEGPKKVTLMSFTKGDMFNLLYADASLTEEHLAGKEKVRMKVVPKKDAKNSGVGMMPLTKNVDWSKFNYMVFNCFVEGDKPWKGLVLIGDKDSYKKWARNYTGIDLTMRPGENKDVHVGIEGLFSAEANRALDMTNIQVFTFYPSGTPPVIYFGNIYLVYEED